MSFGLIARPHVFSAVTAFSGVAAGADPADAGTRQPRDAVLFDLTTGAIDIDLGAAQTVSFAAIVAAQGVTDWALKHADTQAGLATGAALVPTTAVPRPGWRGVSALFDAAGAPAMKRWWRLTLTGTPTFSLGRLVLSDAFVPAFSFEIGRAKGRAPGLSFDEAAGGAVYPRARNQRRRWSATFADITDAEYRDTLDALDDYSAGGGEVLFASDTSLAAGEREDESVYALMSLAQGAVRTQINRWRAPIAFEELI